MTAMPPLRDILNNTPADAINVDFNFNTIEAHVAQELINRDGSVAMTAPLSTQPPTAPQHAATKQYVDTSTPVGTITMFAGATAPAGWVICDGAVKSQTDPLYATLWAVIGTTYNTGGEGTGNFRLPNLVGRFPIGKGATHSPTLGGVGGRTDTPITSHYHDLANHTHSGSTSQADTNHRHTIDHGHTASTSPVPDHDHQSWSGSNVGWFQFGGGTLGPKSVGDFTQGWNASNPTRTSAGGAHTPSVTVNPLSGGYSAYQHQTDGSTNYVHTHTMTTGGPSATYTSTNGVDGTNQNLPPFLTINFIIRIG